MNPLVAKCFQFLIKLLPSHPKVLIAFLGATKSLAITDIDGDGVIDLVDQEADSRKDSPVNTKGIMLDADLDGILDCDDNEIYSPQEFNIDDNGVAIIPIVEKINELSESEIKSLIAEALKEYKPKVTTIIKEAKPEKIVLPKIMYDNDECAIEEQHKDELSQVVNYLMLNPTSCISIEGHADKNFNDDYNYMLSYNRARAVKSYLVKKYGINPDRLKLKYSGEIKPLVFDESQYYLNRRVEFYTCDCSAINMTKPIKK